MTGVLLKAVSAGRPRQVRLLLDSGITMEVKDECGQTPLIRSIFIEHPRNRHRVIKLLLKYGARVSDSDIVGRNALSWACLYALNKEVKLLLEEADIDLNLNQQDVNGQTSLFHAATSGSASVVKLIVDSLKRYDMTIELPNRKGLTPLMQAIKLGHDVCATILIYQGQATVGLSMKGPNDITYAEMWADQRKASLQEHDEVDNPRFLPMLNTASLRMIKQREENATQRTDIPAFCESEDEDKDSQYDSEASWATEDSADTPRFRGLRRRPGTPLSIRTLSMTSSTEANADSESEDEVDAFSSPLTPRQKAMFVPGKQLHAMFSIYEEQSTPSFRPPAAKPKQRNSDASDSTLTNSPRVVISPGPVQFNCDLRKMIARKQLPKSKFNTSQSKFNTSLHMIGSSSESESEKFFTPRLKAPLPSITSSRKQSIKKHRDSQSDINNYSNV